MDLSSPRAKILCEFVMSVEKGWAQPKNEMAFTNKTILNTSELGQRTMFLTREIHSFTSP